MDKETKKNVIHEILLTFDIVIGCTLVAGAIIFAAVYAGKHQPAYGKTISDVTVRRQFGEQIQAELQGKLTMQGQERVLQGVRITDLRFSGKHDQLLIEFALTFDPPATVNGSCILSDDGFGRYSGQWGTENRRVQFLIK